MVKSGLTELQSPAVHNPTPRITSDPRTPGYEVSPNDLGRLPHGGAALQIEGITGRTEHLSRAVCRPGGKAGSPVGREPQGDGALVVVGGWEGQLQGEGGQVDRNGRD